jgi:hypothetical protein
MSTRVIHTVLTTAAKQKNRIRNEAASGHRANEAIHTAPRPTHTMIPFKARLQTTHNVHELRLQFAALKLLYNGKINEKRIGKQAAFTKNSASGVTMLGLEECAIVGIASKQSNEGPRMISRK